MLSQFWLKLAAIVTAVVFFIAALAAWRADRRDRAQLAAELAATKQLLVAADARQHDRDAQLAQTLSALAAEKRAIVSPAQILRELPKNIPLPAPITLPSDQTASVGARFSASPTGSMPQERTTLGSSAPNPAGAPTPEGSLPWQAAPASANTENATPPGAFIPRADLKPLYDFSLDCRACQAKLSAAQADLNDEKTKTAALTKERDDALRIASGGSVWRRVGRAAKWFLLGAAAGAIASKAAH